MTSPSPLDRLAGAGGVLAKEPPDAKEFAGLVRSGLARLKDAENAENSLDSRFDLAYSGAHALCLAALRHHGFRPSKRYIFLGGRRITKKKIIGVLVLFLVAFQIVPISN